MPELLLVCSRCGNEAESRPSEFIGSICVECVILDVLKPYRTEMIRLWNRYNHYVSKGINVANLDHQIKAKFRRGYLKARNAAPSADSARIERLVIHYLITEAQSNAAGYAKIIRPV